MKSLRTLLYMLSLVLLLASCTEKKVYKIGVAQCSKGPWREKVNREMLAAQHLYEHDVKVSIASSVDDPELQARLIDSLAHTDIDLMVVAPYEDIQIINDAIARVLKAGIPVVSALIVKPVQTILLLLVAIMLRLVISLVNILPQ